MTLRRLQRHSTPFVNRSHLLAIVSSGSAVIPTIVGKSRLPASVPQAGKREDNIEFDNPISTALLTSPSLTLAPLSSFPYRTSYLYKTWLPFTKGVVTPYEPFFVTVHLLDVGSTIGLDGELTGLVGALGTVSVVGEKDGSIECSGSNGGFTALYSSNVSE